MSAVQSVSGALAREMNPETVKAQHAEIIELRRRNCVLEMLLRRDHRWQLAVTEWLFAEGEDLVVNTPAGPATLLSLIENQRHADLAEALHGVINGQLPRYLCGKCREPECGGEHQCPQAMRAADDPQRELNVRMPAQVTKALVAVVAAGKAARS